MAWWGDSLSRTPALRRKSRISVAGLRIPGDGLVNRELVLDTHRPGEGKPRARTAHGRAVSSCCRCTMRTRGASAMTGKPARAEKKPDTHAAFTLNFAAMLRTWSAPPRPGAPESPADSIRKAAGHEHQGHVVLQEGLQPGQYEGKPFSRRDDLCDDFFRAPPEAGMRHTYERGVVRPRREQPFDRRGGAIGRPFDEDALIEIEGLDPDLDGEMVHLPIPPDFFARLQPSAAAGEPELGGDGRIDEGLEHVRDRATNEHLGSGVHRPASRRAVTSISI